MDKAYVDTVRLLLQAAPDVFANEIFAMKGGTAINLFVQDMPRLSVDIDIVYLAGHNRPTQEVLFGNDKDIAKDYEENVVGMTREPVSLDTLLQTRSRLRAELPGRLSDKQRKFLTILTRAEPDWSLLQCPHAGDLPALRWKFSNLKIFKERRTGDYNRHISILESKLG